jgi:hypothetical protein
MVKEFGHAAHGVAARASGATSADLMVRDAALAMASAALTMRRGDFGTPVRSIYDEARGFRDIEQVRSASVVFTYSPGFTGQRE